MKFPALFLLYGDYAGGLSRGGIPSPLMTNQNLDPRLGAGIFLAHLRAKKFLRFFEKSLLTLKMTHDINKNVRIEKGSQYVDPGLPREGERIRPGKGSVVVKP